MKSTFYKKRLRAKARRVVRRVQLVSKLVTITQNLRHRKFVKRGGKKSVKGRSNNRASRTKLKLKAAARLPHKKPAVKSSSFFNKLPVKITIPADTTSS